MKIFHEDKLVAVSINSKNMPLILKRVGEYPPPPGLFGFNEETITYPKFFSWIKTRVFPEERIGANELLEKLNLDKYDPIKIAVITQARQFADSYWVDWE